MEGKDSGWEKRERSFRFTYLSTTFSVGLKFRFFIEHVYKSIQIALKSDSYFLLLFAKFSFNNNKYRVLLIFVPRLLCHQSIKLKRIAVARIENYVQQCGVICYMYTPMYFLTFSIQGKQGDYLFVIILLKSIFLEAGVESSLDH